MREDKESDAQVLFDKGLYCAESVVKTIVEDNGIHSLLIPAIATGFCSGVSRTSGMCGSLTGGILALNIVLGRSSETERVDRNYQAVQKLVAEFDRQCGSINCSELLGCDLGTVEGRAYFMSNELRSQCREYVGISTETVRSILRQQLSEEIDVSTG